jgi:hypothetical protein
MYSERNSTYYTTVEARVVSYKLTDVSEIRTASVIWTMSDGGNVHI